MHVLKIGRSSRSFAAEKQVFLQSFLMTLLSLDSFALGVVSSYIGGDDVFRLISIGCPSLTSKLYQSVTHFNFRCYRFSPFPYLAFDLRNVQEVSIQMRQASGLYPLKLRGAPQILTRPCPTLRALRLCFSQAFCVLDKKKMGLPLSELLPSLEILDLTCRFGQVEEEHFSVMPAGLKRLFLNVDQDVPDEPVRLWLLTTYLIHWRAWYSFQPSLQPPQRPKITKVFVRAPRSKNCAF